MATDISILVDEETSFAANIAPALENNKHFCNFIIINVTNTRTPPLVKIIYCSEQTRQINLLQIRAFSNSV